MTEETEKETHQEGNSQKSIAVTPIQLLGIILKIVLKERITDEEVETICSVYYQTVEDWWGSSMAEEGKGSGGAATLD
jgi:hypothetical protein